MFGNKKVNNSGSTLLASLIVLSVFLTVGMIVSNIIIKDISLNRDFGSSNYAYYAANMGYQKALWLLNNELFSNTDANLWDVTFSPFTSSGGAVDMCPDTWDEELNECPCPISPRAPECITSGGKELILSDEIYPGGPAYEVYIFLEYNSASDGLDRTLTLTSIGTYKNAKRKIEYSACIGNGCK